MKLVFCCPRCNLPQRCDLPDEADTLACSGCDWTRPLPPAGASERPPCCLACGCSDLWRQKDFSQRLGLAIVGVAVVLSTIFWAQMRPLLAIGVLMSSALIDLVLYWMMKDALVCYRCGARHGSNAEIQDHPQFNLETFERYRQESARLNETSRKP